MQNHHTDLLTYEGSPSKNNKILVYTKGLVGFYRQTNDPVFKSKQEAQAFYASRYTVDSMPHSDLWYQKGQVYRRLFPTTRKACKALIARLSPSKDWIIKRIQPTENFFRSPNCGYRLFVMGKNMCDPCQKEFGWTINPDLANEIWQGDRYDFSNAILEIGEYQECKEQYRKTTRIFVVKETCHVNSFDGAIQILKANL